MPAEYLAILQSKFFIQAFLAGTALAVSFGLLGSVASLRRAHFFGETLAHTALAGIALGLLVGVHPLPVALIFGVLLASVIPALVRFSGSDENTILAILLPVFLALGVALLSFVPGYQADLSSFLFGSILTVTTQDISTITGLLLILLLTWPWIGKRWLSIAVDEAYAKLIGMRVQWWNWLLQVTLAIFVILGVRLVGVILLNALLVIPATISRSWARSTGWYVLLSVVVSVVMTIVGMLVGTFLDIPLGAAIALTGGVLFSLHLVIKAL